MATHNWVTCVVMQLKPKTIYIKEHLPTELAKLCNEYSWECKLPELPDKKDIQRHFEETIAPFGSKWVSFIQQNGGRLPIGVDIFQDDEDDEMLIAWKPSTLPEPQFDKRWIGHVRDKELGVKLVNLFRSGQLIQWLHQRMIVPHFRCSKEYLRHIMLHMIYYTDRSERVMALILLLWKCVWKQLPIRMEWFDPFFSALYYYVTGDLPNCNNSADAEALFYSAIKTTKNK